MAAPRAASRPGVASRETGSDPPALIVADPGAERDRLAGELSLLGFPSIARGSDPPWHDVAAWVALVVVLHDLGTATRRVEAARSVPGFEPVPVLWLVRPDAFAHVPDLDGSDDFIGVPYAVAELGVRLRRLRRRSGHDDPDLIRGGPLAMNVATYHVTLLDRTLDLTFMEFELLKLLVRSPGRVFTRDEILARVWGYDYFGGMRTVDVHIRRVRSKLGQDHAWLIETVRSVGYRFAQVHP